MYVYSRFTSCKNLKFWPKTLIKSNTSNVLSTRVPGWFPAGQKCVYLYAEFVHFVLLHITSRICFNFQMTKISDPPAPPPPPNPQATLSVHLPALKILAMSVGKFASTPPPPKKMPSLRPCLRCNISALLTSSRREYCFFSIPRAGLFSVKIQKKFLAINNCFCPWNEVRTTNKRLFSLTFRELNG